MQVSLSEKILGHLHGSSKENPVIESGLFRLGQNNDVIKTLNELDSARKIIRCKITKNEVTNDLVFLSAQIARAGKFHLDDESRGKETTGSSKLRFCKGCNKDLPFSKFARYTRQCIDCQKLKPVVLQKEKKDKDVVMRYCLMCKEHHPASSFAPAARRCIATTDQHAMHKTVSHNLRQKMYRENRKVKSEQRI